MQNNVPNTVKDYLRSHAKQRRWRGIVAGLSCLVILGTVYTLSLPATTMSTDTFCGLEEHVHSEECYEQILVCENADPAELSVHMHSDDCYEVQRELVCTQEINEDGTDHEHTDECYQDEAVLVCPIVETAEDKSAEHIHSEECYAMELICEKQEHTHTLQCHSNPYAVENSDLWTQGIPTLSGKPVQDLVAMAESQLGYTESTENFHVNEDGSLSGYTRYGAWYGGANDSDFAYGDWCASFVSFCLNYAGIPQSDFPYSAGCEDWTARLTERGLYKEATDHTPQAGDIVFLNMNGYGADHVGIVTDADENTVYTIEGNLNGRVARNSHSLIGGEILGYGVLPDNQAKDVEDPENDAQISTESDGHETIEISVSTRQSAYHDPKIAEDGTLLYYTGESAVTTLNISNPTSSAVAEDDGAVVRLYMKFSDAASEEGRQSVSGTPSMLPGEYTISAKSGVVYKYTVTKLENDTYCFEIQRPINGDTINLELPSGFPSPTSAGGTNEVWGVILTKEEKEALDAAGTTGIAPKPTDGSAQTIRWETKADDFSLRKYQQGASVKNLELKGDGKGGAYISNLEWEIELKRTGNTLEGVGKDYMTYAEYSDTITLPEGMTWDTDVYESIRDGSCSLTYTYVRERSGYAWQISDRNGRIFAELGAVKSSSTASDYNTMLSAEMPQLSLTEDGKVNIRWAVYHQQLANQKEEVRKTDVPSAEMKAFTTALDIKDNVLLVEKPETDKDYVIHNEVDCRKHYSWSAPQEDNAQNDVEVTPGSGRFLLTKTRTSPDNRKMGDPASYTITAENPGVGSYDSFAYLEDTLPRGLYLSGSNMAQLLTDAQFGNRLTITIQKASICETPDAADVTDTSGNVIGGITAGNTSPDGDPNKYHGKQSTDPSVIDENGTIVLERDRDSIRITYGDKSVTCPSDGSAIQSALDAMGLVITKNTTYKLSWDMRDENGVAYSLAGGEKITFDLPCTIKTTFMNLEQDTEYRYPNAFLSMGYNYAYAYSAEQKPDGSKKEIASASGSSFSASYEVSLAKNAVTADGATLEKIPEDGSVIKYTLDVYTSGNQTAPLPLTDHMSGGQVLLAKVEENRDADWAANMTADDIFTDADGTAYYKLKNLGEYHDVWLNGKLADTVLVSDSADGRDTIIKWYLSSFPNRTEKYSYNALFCPKELTPSAAAWSLGNESWLNDHETHRLYASIPGLKTTVFSFSKRIVSEADIDADKKEAGTDYSAVSEGETVYYRLAFYPAEEDAEYTITGRDLYDVLPLGLTQGNTEVLSWKKGSSEAPGSVWIVDYQGYADGSLQNGDHYHITTDTSNKNQQTLVWEDDFSLTVGTEPVYIYLRLTFPTGNAWEKYAAKYSTEKLKNTLYVYGTADEVTHTLSIPAKAYLQKGVYTTEGYRRASNDAPIRPSGDDSLFYYSNHDALYHTVTYYVVLYNAGTTKLYVQDLQDILPEGFSLKWLRWDGSINQDKKWTDGLTAVTNGEGFGKSTTGERVTWKSVNVKATVDKNDPQRVSFHIGKGNSGSSIAYDEEVGMYYLNPKEGLSFGYSCATNNREDTQDVAVNRIAMPYYDFNEGGVVVSNTSSFARDRSLNRGTLDYLPNEGTCNLMDNAQAEQNGFTGGQDGTQWLASDVTVVRGDIQPGITKALTSVVTASGTENKGPIVAAHPTDTLRWTITADNDGEYGIQDYVLTDTMQSPYEFTGKVNYVIKSQSGSVCAQAVSGYLFSVDKVDNGTVTLKSNRGTTATADINGEPAEITINWLNARSGGGTTALTIKVQFKEDTKNGTFTISIRFENLEFGIPQDCSGILTLDTKDPTNNLENRVYVNSCFITPMSQVWDGTASKGNMTTLDAQDEGEKPTVRNSAPVTTSYGYTTSSLKSVSQADDPSNATDCNSTPNYIVLPDKQTVFTYTLSVENADKAMDSIVLIDGLPEPGDHTSFQSDDPRFSEFKVRFADDPQISVRVIAQDNTVTELSPDQFTVEFSTKTDFDRNDWAGSSVWDSALAEAKSLRIKIKDDSGTLIPAKATLSVRFNAVIDGEAEPGQIAWNSFGYHYSVVGGGGDLEAAPLKVGVMLPTVPKIQKTLTGNDGAAVSAVQDETFRFLCYTGTSLKITEESQLGEALNAANRKATLIELKVPAGSSVSELATLLDCVVWDYTDNGWVKTEEPWAWTDQAQYTLVELPSEESLYQFGSINKSATATGYSFYYRSGEQLTLSAVNILDTWNFTIRKVDADDASALNGAWFALYSPNEEDKLTQEAYEAIMAVPHQKPAETIEYDGRTWYLAQVGQSQEQNGMSGALLWDGLFRDEYLYCEVQAPQGHALDSTIHLARKDDSVHSITITNEKSGYELPQTGGFGTMPIYLAGVALLLTAGMLSSRKKRTQT